MTTPSLSTKFPLQTQDTLAAVPTVLNKFASRTAEFLASTPVEGVAFLVASVVVRIFSASLSAPLFGIGASFIATRLVFKAIECYDPKVIIDLKIEVYRLIAKYPSVQKAAICFALAVSFISQQLGMISGAAVGGFVSITLDVENYKLIQKSKRDSLLKTS